MGEVLSYAAAQSRTETEEGIMMDSVAFALPSLWPKLIGVLKILLIEVVASRLGGNRCTLTDGDVFDVVIFIRHSEEYAVDWSIVSGRLVLDPIDIGQFF
jgi:hypothetical protein